MRKQIEMNQEHEVVLYQIEGTNICVNVMFKEETFWMTQRQWQIYLIAQLIISLYI